MNVIISVKPQYANQIMNGEKKFEYRKRDILKSFDKLYIYSTSPVKKIIGEARVKEVLRGDPLKIWETTYLMGGITAGDYMKYFEKSKTAFAFKLDEVIKYKKPLNYEKIDPTGKVPQSFKYIE